MIYVYLLTIMEKDYLEGSSYAPDCNFNPIQDAKDNWVISQEEVNQTVNEQFLWVKDLPLIEYKPKEIID